MPFNDIEKFKYEKIADKFLEKRRPPIHIRNKLDISYKIIDTSIEIYEIRPSWRDEKEILETPVAKAKFIKKTKTWKIYWQRADLKWHKYDPNPEVQLLDDFFKIVDEDKNCCFWG
ncbi:MAG: hypothetical protein CVV50_03925 [Spirochaetae bacterium HGW-Spirochaetae-6]|nr:MAG: hypothetical protein CVV50_03925 [Spirochaetae bacterium HGW-Spirochaetae-6]